MATKTATVEGTTFSWLTDLLAEAQTISDEQFKKLIAGVSLAESDEETFEVPKEIANLLVYTYQLTKEMEKSARQHIANHIASLGEENEDHSPDQCARIRTDENFVGHKVTMLKSLFWVAIWEHLEQPAKNFSIRKREDTLVVETSHEGLDIEDLSGLVIGSMKDGLGLLSRLFR